MYYLIQRSTDTIYGQYLIINETECQSFWQNTIQQAIENFNETWNYEARAKTPEELMQNHLKVCDACEIIANVPTLDDFKQQYPEYFV